MRHKNAVLEAIKAKRGKDPSREKKDLTADRLRKQLDPTFTDKVSKNR